MTVMFSIPFGSEKKKGPLMKCREAAFRSAMALSGLYARFDGTPSKRPNLRQGGSATIDKEGGEVAVSV
jgi:hypothetical protein